MPWLAGFSALAAAVRVRPEELVAVDDPVSGRFDGSGAVERYREASREWLAPAEIHATSIGSAVGDRRAVGEFEVAATTDDRTVVLPLACLVDATGPDGPTARVYLSEWVHNGRRVRRGPLLDADPAARPDGIVGRYWAALGAGDAPGCVACYEPDGALQGGGGPAFAVRGTASLSDAYAGALARGGIVLEPVTLTVDGARIGAEFTLRSWGGAPLHQAGLSVYTLGATGRLAWNRVYDDVAPPADNPA
jgi:hypothetical protein